MCANWVSTANGRQFALNQACGGEGVACVVGGQGKDAACVVGGQGEGVACVVGRQSESNRAC